jgi:hypothetical protein
MEMPGAAGKTGVFIRHALDRLVDANPRMVGKGKRHIQWIAENINGSAGGTAGYERLMSQAIHERIRIVYFQKTPARGLVGKVFIEFRP